MSTSTKRRAKNGRAGATAVEFAITAPALFLFVFTSVEFARINMIRHTVDNAAYEAARAGIIPGATSQKVEGRARSIMNYVGAVDVDVVVTPTVIIPETNQVTVKVTVPCNQNGFLAPFLFADGLLVGRATMTRESL